MPRRRRSWKPKPSEIVGMALTGLLVGLVVAWAPTGLVEPRAQAPTAFEDAEAFDPWAESRRSREILGAQEGAPAPLAGERAATGGRTVSPASVSIIDGDTFRYGGEKIRIADIDTPEVRGQCAYEIQLASRATARMSELLSAGPFELSPIPGRDEDQYGRKLRVVTRGGQSLGDQLVAEGLARTWSGRREPWC
jgi:endonuclease YncB( thermonuclease family)